MKRNQDRVRKNGSHTAAASQPKTSQTAGVRRRRKLTFRFADESGAETLRLLLDERQEGLMTRAAAATGLNLAELFVFIIDRQMEAFFPAGEDDLFSVREDASKEITTGLIRAGRAAAALMAVAPLLMLPAFAGTWTTAARGRAPIASSWR